MRLSNQTKEDLKLLAALIIAALFLSCIGIGCPFRFFIGIPCAGCGMSRALLSLLRFDFRSAFQYHPLSFLMPFCFLIWLFRSRLSGRVQKAVLYTTISLFIIVYLIRLLCADPVLSFGFDHCVFAHIYKEVNHVLFSLRQ